jgi:hypothetical protein
MKYPRGIFKSPSREEFLNLVKIASKKLVKNWWNSASLFIVFFTCLQRVISTLFSENVSKGSKIPVKT